ncbi:MULTISPECIES: winged helix-turn-helix transcriptional regulator [unclassified Methylobacterium]|uniref:winged helix-turn-helix transcriptional regulator n=1 Tax=unclassified Methylobacterium TaxID=2615210 RepID=UPI0006F229CD|nr:MULTISPECIES: winged helix-turn-helix transcriptional regulator [unclassified Methylobacterium]KQO53950.1 hypothetical protein ASF24_21995 [Methylobacterium sp. Leaf86]KQO93290.1 hypothetical protein ASF32_03370 [Methylobacterium sp. Leaf91]
MAGLARALVIQRLRFSDLERAIPAISQKMLVQRLRGLEADGIVTRLVHHQFPPKVEYSFTEWGQSLCPMLDALLKWAAAPDTQE